MGLPAGLGSSRPVTEADVQKVGGVQVARHARPAGADSLCTPCAGSRDD